jgi:uncharacterized protein
MSENEQGVQGEEISANAQRPPRRLTWLIATMAVLLVIQLPLPGWFVPGDGLAAQVGREAVFWVLTAALIAYVLKFERRPLMSIGLRRLNWKSVAFGIAGAAVMIGGMAAIYLILFPWLGFGSGESQLAEIQATPVWFRLLLISRAAVFEEFFYRGFAIERIDEITGLRWLAALISLTAFTVAHLSFWGWQHLIVAAFGGIVLTLLYLWRRDLGCNMIAHFVTDGVGFLIG